MNFFTPHSNLKHHRERRFIGSFEQDYQSLRGFFTSNTNLEHHREKRFIGPFIAAALGGGLSGLFSGGIFGLYNGKKIEALENAFNQMEFDRLKMVHTMEAIAYATRDNRLEINKMETAFLGLSKELQEEIKTERIVYLINLIDQVNSVMRTEIDKYHRIIESSLHHRLPYGIFSKQEYNGLISKLQGSIENTNYKVGISQMQHLYQCETSIVFLSKGKAALYVHIPIVQDQPLSLYKFHGFPIHGEHNFHINVRPREEVIGIDKDRHYYVEYTLEELSTCTKISQDYICPHLQQLKDVRNNPSCLSSLMNSQIEMAGKICPLEVTPVDEVVINLGNNTFLTTHPNKTTIKEVCQDGHESLKEISKAEKITVQDGCHVILPSHKLYGIGELEYQSEFQAFNWTLNFTTLLPQLIPSKIEKIMTDLKENSLPPLDPSVYKMLDHLKHPHLLPVIPYAGHLVMGAVAFLLLFFVIGVFLFCCAYHRCCCFNVYQPVSTTPIIKGQLYRL